MPFKNSVLIFKPKHQLFLNYRITIVRNIFDVNSVFLCYHHVQKTFKFIHIRYQDSKVKLKCQIKLKEEEY